MVDSKTLQTVNSDTCMKMRRLIVITVIFQILLLGIESFMRYDTNVRQAALAVTNIVTTLGVLLLDRFLQRRGAGLSAITVVMVAAAVWIDALGNFQGLYGQFWWWDRVTHATGGLAVSALFMDVALARRKILAYTIAPTTVLWFGYFLGQFVAAMYEVSEWLGDWWFHTERVRGPYDSPRDLFFNAFGGIVILFIMRMTRRDQSNENLAVLEKPEKMV